MRSILPLCALPILLAAAKPPPATVQDTKTLPGFGSVPVYHPRDLAHARGVVLFISGDGGWNLGVVDMARRLADRSIVVGLSMPAWQKRVEKSPGSCWYPAGELEVAAQAVEKLYALPRYVRPILVGYSSGATVVYGALAQGPPTTFRGAVSLGFCPDLEVKRPFCGTPSWEPKWDAKKRQSWLPETSSMPDPPAGGPSWVALQGTIDEVCSPQQTIDFVGRVPHAKVVELQKVGHGFSVPSHWGAAFDASVAEMFETGSILDPTPHVVRRGAGDASPSEVLARLETLDLPLEVVWPKDTRAVSIFVSGDGGWADLDEGVAKGLASHGVAVVGWNTLRYFWSAKPPERFAHDLGRVIAAIPEGLPLFAGGYSFGAETVSVVAAAGREPSLTRLAGLVLIAPGRNATFEVSPLDWLMTRHTDDSHPVAPSIETTSRPVLCLAPEKDNDTGCPTVARPGYSRQTLPGGHHFGSDYDEIASRIVAFVDGTIGTPSDSSAGSKAKVTAL